MGELPEPWSTAAERAGIRQTLRGIGEASGISHVTVRRLVFEGRTSSETVAAVAKALRIDEAQVFDWARIPRSDWGPWTPPMEAHKLNPRARAALTELILAITQEDEPNARSAAREKTPDPPTLTDSATLADDPPTLQLSRAEQRRRRLIENAQPVDKAADDRGPEENA